ncbi:MAG: NUDIX hydrolase [Fibrobacteria bacterium]
MLALLKSIGSIVNENQGIVAIILFVVERRFTIISRLLKQWRGRKKSSITPDLALPPALDWVAKLNTVFKKEIELVLLKAEPKVRIDGVLALTVEQAIRRAEIKDKLAINDGVVVLSKDPILTDTPVILNALTTDFAAVCTLDELGRRPVMISANAVVVCPDTKQIVLHRRSKVVSRDYPGALHTFGGAYMPQTARTNTEDQLSLVHTAHRELREESGFNFDLEIQPPLLLGRELRIGFLHVALLGVTISSKSLLLAKPNGEGEIVTIDWNELQKLLLDDSWVPAGRAQVLAWLAIGAPHSAGRATFNGMNGQKLFDIVVENLIRSKATTIRT